LIDLEGRRWIARWHIGQRDWSRWRRIKHEETETRKIMGRPPLGSYSSIAKNHTHTYQPTIVHCHHVYVCLRVHVPRHSSLLRRSFLRIPLLYLPFCMLLLTRGLTFLPLIKFKATKGRQCSSKQSQVGVCFFRVARCIMDSHRSTLWYYSVCLSCRAIE
jgi:hypothetical protein